MAAGEGQDPAAGLGVPRGPAEADGDRMGLTDLPGELLELILCCDVLGAADIGRVSCTCRRLREACQPRGKVWRELFRLRWAPRPGEGGGGAGRALSARAGPRWSGSKVPLGWKGPGASWGMEPNSSRHPIPAPFPFPAP